MDNKEQQPFSEVLTELLNNEQVPLRHLHRLSDMSAEDWQLWQQHWENAADERRYALIRHCADLAEDNFVVDFEPLFAACLHDLYAPVREAALDGLWDSSDVALVPPIIELMKEDPATAVRKAAAGALAHFVLLVQLGDLPLAIEPLLVSALVDVYEDSETAAPVKGAALEAMGSINSPQTTKFILEAYENGHNDLQVSALFAMGSSVDERWLNFLYDEMESPYAEMRAEAARAVGMIGKSESASQLAELVFDEEQEVAEAAVVALGLIGGGKAISLLEQFAEDPEMEHLLVVIDEALEEADWLEDEFPLHTFDGFDDDDDEDLIAFDPDSNGTQVN